ncbi:MAG TPA: hypothetical protein VK971_07055 [Thiohalobacter sp.]|nr:hypothetical protein [Thiohalobacter sp.]
MAVIATDEASIKAATTEQMGFTGRREGIAVPVGMPLPDEPPLAVDTYGRIGTPVM